MIMGNLIMPKQTSQMDRFIYSIKIFYDSYNNDDKDVKNIIFKQKMMEHFQSLRENNDGAKIVKQSEMARYFGMALHDYSNSTTSITNRGIFFYEAYNNHDYEKCIDLLMESIFNDSFGRGNTAIKSSDSDVDPPKLFLKAIIDLNGISRKELALLLYYTHDLKLEYEAACNELRSIRKSSSESSIYIAPDRINKYGDPKFSIFLVNMGICCINADKVYELTRYVFDKYKNNILKLNIYNSIPLAIININSNIYQDTSFVLKDTDCSDEYKVMVSQTVAYDMKSCVFNNQNNRTPSKIGNLYGNNRYLTDIRIAKTALMLAEHKCEYDKSHITFLGKNELPFMEGHHLIPMLAQEDYCFNLDRIENIISLCPNCHSAIHYGNEVEREKILFKLFSVRNPILSKLGIKIDFQKLLKEYYK